MFGIEKEILVKSLEKVRRRLCCYHPNAPFCDCKYIGEDATYPDPTGGENTGCCEVRMAINLIHVMTDEEFNELCKRAKVMII